MLSLFSVIKAFVFDIDGVLTDGMLHVPEEGELLRRMNIKDGYALQLAVKKGFKVWIISGGKSEAVRKRLKNLGVHEVYLSAENKKACLQQLMDEAGLDKEQVLYMGDDMPDLAAMELCGLKTCPEDAVSDIRKIADYISPYAGGQGCVRDVIEKTMKIAGVWE